MVSLDKLPALQWNVKSSLTDYDSRAGKFTTYRFWIISHIARDKKHQQVQISHTFSSGNEIILVYIVIFFPPVLFRFANAKATRRHKLELQLYLMWHLPAQLEGTRYVTDYSWERDREVKVQGCQAIKKIYTN